MGFDDVAAAGVPALRQRILFAPDSFKGTIDAGAAASALARGWADVRPDDELLLRPMADGGEGTLAAFEGALPGACRMPVSVTGPLGHTVDAFWLLLPGSSAAPAGTAVVELAATSGIGLLGAPPLLRPLEAHTRGFGEAIAAALQHRVSKLVLAIGGSASTDGGAGMLQALGARLVDAGGAPIASGGRGLAALTRADLGGLPRLPPAGVTVLSDVTSPLLGAAGAAAVFGPQKGASPREVAALDAGLAVLAARLGGDPSAPGTGAAGGVGYALQAWGAHLVAGSTAVGELIGLADALAAASLVVTGEGSFDHQSSRGKVVGEVLRLAAAADVGVALAAGRIAPAAGRSAFTATVELTELAGDPESAMAEPARWLRKAGTRLARVARV